MAELSGEDVQAEKLYKRALRYFEHKHGADSVQLAQGFIEFANFLEKKERIQEADECYSRMRQILCFRLTAADLDVSDA